MFDEENMDIREGALLKPVEVYKLSDMPESAVTDLKEYSKIEAENTLKFVRENGTDHPESVPRMEDQLQITLYGPALIDRSRDSDGYAFISRDQEDQIVGIGTLVLDMRESDPNRVQTQFIGRSYDAKKMGIAAQILEKQHEKLKERGIQTYKTNVFPSSRRVLERAGTNMESLSKNEKSGTELMLVKL